MMLRELEAVEVPILDYLEKVTDVEKAHRALMGRLRVSTVRRYMAYWQRFRQWVTLQHGSGTRATGIHLVDYLYTREEEGLGPSVPLAVMKSVMWFEGLADIPEEDQISNKPFVTLVVSDLTRRLESQAPPVKRAPRWPSVFLGPMEDLLMDDKQKDHVRITACFKLLKLWAGMRFDDAANIKGENLRFYDGKVAGVLTQTKTTGAGKRVRELPIYVGADAFVKHPEWLQTGLALVRRVTGKAKGYLFTEGLLTGGKVGADPVKYPEAVAASVEMMESLGGRGDRPLIPHGWTRFWTEHSERSTMVSGLAAVGVPKDERDLLGRWKPEGSDQYLRTYNAAVGAMQKRYAGMVKDGTAYERFDEGIIFEDLKRWLRDAWTADEEQADHGVENWKRQLKLGSVPMVEVRVMDTPTDALTPTELAGNSSGEEAVGEAPIKRMRKSPGVRDEDRGGGEYVVVYRRAGRGTLHRLGPTGCWMAKRREFKKCEAHETCPPPETYSVRCRLCWPAKEAEDDESTSDSHDDLDLSDPEAR